MRDSTWNGDLKKQDNREFRLTNDDKLKLIGKVKLLSSTKVSNFSHTQSWAATLWQSLYLDARKK